jgi:hypothetical protein
LPAGSFIYRRSYLARNGLFVCLSQNFEKIDSQRFFIFLIFPSKLIYYVLMNYNLVTQLKPEPMFRLFLLSDRCQHYINNFSFYLLSFSANPTHRYCSKQLLEFRHFIALKTKNFQIWSNHLHQIWIKCLSSKSMWFSVIDGLGGTWLLIQTSMVQTLSTGWVNGTWLWFSA